MRLFKEIITGSHDVEAFKEGIVVKISVYLPDRPGSLENLATLIASLGGNITFFYYNRSDHSNKVTLEVHLDNYNSLSKLLAEFTSEGYTDNNTSHVRDSSEVTAIENILEIKVRLKNVPGSLASFANILKEQGANVIYMLYDEDIDEESATISMALNSPSEIEPLLNALNLKGYQYRMIYKGTETEEAVYIIGLKLCERFFIRLRKLMTDADIAEIRGLVASSKELYEDLLGFYQESGKDLEAGDVYEKVLTLASRCRSKTGSRFSAIAMPPISTSGKLKICGFRMPTSENIYLLIHENGISMIDTGHGIYYEDIKRLLISLGFETAKVDSIYITHADTDHIGCAGYFEQEFGTKVYMHKDGLDIIKSMNRGHGLIGRFANLNRYYTKLSATLTACCFPKSPIFFSQTPIGCRGIFDVIDSFNVGGVTFEVLQSLEGHIKGQVFFLSEEEGLLFASDYIINYKSLTKEEKDHLGTYNFLLTNPNSNIEILTKELSSLKSIASEMAKRLIPKGKSAIIMPGHGEHFGVNPDNPSI
ncbi:MAG: MBL fold metallo-hydrolase [Thermodesulfovibrionales bacterium]